MKIRYSFIDLLVQCAEEFVASARAVAHLGTWARRPAHGRVMAAKLSRNWNLDVSRMLNLATFVKEEKWHLIWWKVAQVSGVANLIWQNSCYEKLTSQCYEVTSLKANFCETSCKQILQKTRQILCNFNQTCKFPSRSGTKPFRNITITSRKMALFAWLFKFHFAALEADGRFCGEAANNRRCDWWRCRLHIQAQSPAHLSPHWVTDQVGGSLGSNRSSLGFRIASSLGFRIASPLGFRIASSYGSQHHS